MKKKYTLLSLIGFLGISIGCSNDSSLPAAPDVSADSSNSAISSATTATSSSSKGKKAASSASVKSSASKKTSDTTHVEYIIQDTSEAPYFSSASVFCWEAGCESHVSSSAAKPKSSSSKAKAKSSSSNGASIEIPSDTPPTINGLKMTDERDKQVYTLQQVGNTLWMAQDLNYKSGSSKCFNDEDSNCSTYGRLYTFSTAKNVCPAGWRLPNRAEVQAVIDNDSFPWSYSGRCKSGECNFTGQMGFHWTSASPESGDKKFDENQGDSYTTILVEKEPGYADGETEKFFQVDDKSKYFSVRCVQDTAN